MGGKYNEDGMKIGANDSKTLNDKANRDMSKERWHTPYVTYRSHCFHSHKKLS